MPWIRLDEGFPDHRKLAELGDVAPLAGWLFICGLAYCNRQLTDGRIPKVAIHRLANFHGIGFGNPVGTQGPIEFEETDAHEIAAELVQVNLWEDQGTHYLVHDYLVYQPSRAAIEAERRQKVEAGQLGGIASAQARAKAAAKAAAKARAKALAQAGAQAGAQAESKPDPDPEDLKKDQEQIHARARENGPRTPSQTEARRMEHDWTLGERKPWRLRCRQRGHDPACPTPKDCELLALRETP